MDSQVEALEEKVKSLLDQLQAECAIFERLVYKNKNQHRRSSYFQYLLKVRRDLRLLKSAKLGELLDSCFQVITGNRPKQKVHLLESLKGRKCDGGKHNFMEQLMEAACILSQRGLHFACSFILYGIFSDNFGFACVPSCSGSTNIT
ncbi:hypothetical protein LWI28_017643 [Acer negundo]|uniref:Nucleolus and neural progenitor protein-like N-terminal domain-containing protein n=1 Tax=Acer negundo TaxID=4023 RepID=A0AAD5JBG7_ACENE|nr:hypothetical protein LWI28_017643 [Acer negundo]